MTGCKSRGGTLLKKEQPLLFTLHCLAHRLELGFKGITEANTFMATFTELLFSIYNFYHSSALKRDNLKTSCAALGIKFLVPSRVGGTRWLPHTMQAPKKLWSIHPALMQHLTWRVCHHKFVYCYKNASSTAESFVASFLLLYSAYKYLYRFK